MSKNKKEVSVACSSSDGLNAIKLSLISDAISHLMGQVLTIIDASTEGEKNKAMKDLIRSKFSEAQNGFLDSAFKEIQDENTETNMRYHWEDGLVPLSVIGGKFYSFKK
jgi:hypothetical protein